MNVISQSSRERDDEIVEIFNKMRPLLDNGESYTSALKMIMGNNRNYSGTRFFKDLKEYGESQGYLFRAYNVKNRYPYGLLNVLLTRMSSSRTGYIWIYNYYVDGVKKTISSMDLRELRRKVESKNLIWKVVNMDKARDSYERNLVLLEDIRPLNYRTSSGVRNVCKYNTDRYGRGYCWQYIRKGKLYFESKSIEELRLKVLERDLPWVVIDPEKYKNNREVDIKYYT